MENNLDNLLGKDSGKMIKTGQIGSVSDINMNEVSENLEAEKLSLTLGHQYKKALKQIVINAYNAGWQDSENKGLDDYSAEKYYKENFE